MSHLKLLRNFLEPGPTGHEEPTQLVGRGGAVSAGRPTDPSCIRAVRRCRPARPRSSPSLHERSVPVIHQEEIASQRKTHRGSCPHDWPRRQRFLEVLHETAQAASFPAFWQPRAGRRASPGPRGRCRTTRGVYDPLADRAAPSVARLPHRTRRRPHRERVGPGRANGC